MHFDLKGTLYFGYIYKVTILAEDPHTCMAIQKIFYLIVKGQMCNR